MSKKVTVQAAATKSTAPAETVVRTQMILAGGLVLVVLGAAYWWLPLWFTFPTSLLERLVFALQVSSVPLAVLLVAVLLVALGRRGSPADSLGSAYGPPSQALAVPAAFLQNTLEQTVLQVGAILVLATVLSGPELALLPALALLFVVGRTTFYLGYTWSPLYRAFGMGLTLLPTLLAYSVIAVMLGSALINLLR